MDGVDELDDTTEADGVEELDGVEEADGVDGVEAPCEGEAGVAGRFEGLTEAAPVSELPLALDSPVV